MNKDNTNKQNQAPHQVPAVLKAKKKPQMFARLFASSLLLAGCGDTATSLATSESDGSSVQMDGGMFSHNDGGAIQKDGGSAQKDGGTAVKCTHKNYFVLKVGETEKVVNDGATVMVNGKKYTVNDAQDGSIVLHNGSDYNVVKDKATVNGVQVAYLGSGTTLVDAALLQVEYYNGEVDSKSLALGVGKSGQYHVDDRHYVTLTLKSAVKTDKVEYAVVEAEVFVQSEKDGETFVSVKTERYTVDLNGATQIVVDENTNLVVNLDLLGSGTLNASANISVNGRQLSLKAGDKPYETVVGEDEVTVGVLSAFYSEDVSRATLVINTPTQAVVIPQLPGEKSNLEVNDSGMLLHVEFLGCEPVCDE